MVEERFGTEITGVKEKQSHKTAKEVLKQENKIKNGPM